MRMSVRSSSALAAVLGVTMGPVSGSVLAEERTVRAMSPWQGSGQVYAVAPDKRMILGRYAGIMYIENGEGSLDAAIMLCPAVQNIDTKTKKVDAFGHCVISEGEESLVYSEWKCKGSLGGCDGEFKITGGTGEFEGISGGGKMQVRAALIETAVDLSSGAVVRDAAGLAVWPELKYKIPSK